MEAQVRVATLRDALRDSRISPHYDEPFMHVSQQIAERQSAGKGDIAVIAFWKRVRADTPWVADLLSMSEAAVRAITAEAVREVRSAPDVAVAARRGRDALRSLPGFRSGDPLASALLCAIDPVRLAVYDVRAERGLQIVGTPVPKGRRGVHDYYARYMTVIEHLRREGRELRHDWSPREVDIALYQIGKRPRRGRSTSGDGPSVNSL